MCELQLTTILELSPIAIAYTDKQLNVLKTNTQFFFQFGYNEDIGILSNLISHPTKKIEFENSCLTNIFQSKKIEYELETQNKEGDSCWTYFRGKLIDLSNQEQGLIWMIDDISDQKSALKGLQLSASVFDYSGEAMIILNTNGNVIKSNLAMQKLMGYDLQKPFIQPAIKLFRSPDSQKPISELLALIEHQWQGELWLQTKNNVQFPARIIINSVRDSEGEICHFVAVLADISEHKAQEQELQYRANHDSLTGLPNRSSFFKHLNNILATAKRNEYEVALLYLDLDGFKPINDTLGHGRGDQVLLDVAGKLKHDLREVDIVARLGGDEFAIILNGTSKEFVTLTAERLIETISTHLEESLFLSVSIGIAVYPFDTINPFKLLQYADEAMYKAKNQGKHSFCWHNTQSYS